MASSRKICIGDLPDEVLQLVLSKVPFHDRHNAAPAVCRAWRDACRRGVWGDALVDVAVEAAAAAAQGRKAVDTLDVGRFLEWFRPRAAETRHAALNLACFSARDRSDDAYTYFQDTDPVLVPLMAALGPALERLTVCLTVDFDVWYCCAALKHLPRLTSLALVAEWAYESQLEELSALTALEELSIEVTEPVRHARVPAALRTLTRLRALALTFSNEDAAEPLPEWLGGDDGGSNGGSNGSSGGSSSSSRDSAGGDRSRAGGGVGMTQLQHLALRGFNFASFPAALTRLTALTHLDLGWNRIDPGSFPQGLSALGALTALALPHAVPGAGAAPAAIGLLPALRCLDLSGNGFHSGGGGGSTGGQPLPAVAGGGNGGVHVQQQQQQHHHQVVHPSVAALAAAAAGGAPGDSPRMAGTGGPAAAPPAAAAAAAAGGALAAPSGTAAAAATTTTAQRNGSGGMALPASFRRLAPRLEQLRMAGTPPSPCALRLVSTMARLEVLDVSRCGLESLPGCLSALAALRVLDASANRLRRFPGWVARLPALRALLLQGNCGMALGPEALPLAGLPCLEVVDLRRCSSGGGGGSSVVGGGTSHSANRESGGNQGCPAVGVFCGCIGCCVGDSGSNSSSSSSSSAGGAAGPARRDAWDAKSMSVALLLLLAATQRGHSDASGRSDGSSSSSSGSSGGGSSGGRAPCNVVVSGPWGVRVTDPEARTPRASPRLGLGLGLSGGTALVFDGPWQPAAVAAAVHSWVGRHHPRWAAATAQAFHAATAATAPAASSPGNGSGSVGEDADGGCSVVGAVRGRIASLRLQQRVHHRHHHHQATPPGSPMNCSPQMAARA